MTNWYKPNFFIIGAPKCGTTSLASYLGGHPNIYMSNPKEPYYFNSDMNFQGMKTIKEYATCFAGAGENHLAIGEASTSYLYSKAALPAILKFNPAAKFVVVVRNPVDLLYSFHSELLWNGTENIKSFRDAWQLQEARLAGRHIPPLCRDPFWLQYKEVGLLGKYLKRVYQMVATERVHVVVMDDMKLNVQKVYEDLLSFLDVPLITRDEFPVHNQSKTVRHQIIRDWIHIAASIKRRTGINLNMGLLSGLLEINTKIKERAPLPANFREELNTEFRQDIEKLSSLLGRDLTYWSHIK